MSDTLPPPENENLSPNARKILKVIFLTLFIDLIGFSIIFPLFPSMLTYYHETEAAGSLFARFHEALTALSLQVGVPDTDWGVIVLFGGVLGSLYSLLQFLCAPIFGAVSDRWGRRPVLLIGLSGLLVSYLLWVFAGSFLLLLLSRFIAGIMSANISTATAVVADITSDRTRSKGMAIIGIAFGVGFIIGPALGGASALLDLTQVWPSLARYGINPYSMPAALAMVLTLINMVSVWRSLPETRPEATSKTSAPKRTANPLRIFGVRGYRGVSRTNWVYFLYILAFSGMEFSLTFLAAEALNYGPGRNAVMFIFTGLVLALVQGGYVRRRAQQVGDLRMSRRGLWLSIPGLLLIALTAYWSSNMTLYAGLLLLAAGSAMATPCLTALVSVYTPAEDQGRIMGVFRSLGALARAVGPFVAALLYWRLGAGAAYAAAGVFLLLPLVLAHTLPRPAALEPDASAA